MSMLEDHVKTNVNLFIIIILTPHSKVLRILWSLIFIDVRIDSVQDAPLLRSRPRRLPEPDEHPPARPQRQPALRAGVRDRQQLPTRSIHPQRQGGEQATNPFEDFTITEKAPTRTFCLLKGPSHLRIY